MECKGVGDGDGIGFCEGVGTVVGDWVGGVLIGKKGCKDVGEGVGILVGDASMVVGKGAGIAVDEVVGIIISW